MGIKCFVDTCKSVSYVRKKGDENLEKRHFFSPCSEAMLNSWRKAIPRGINFQKINKICDLHFEEGDIITEFVHQTSDGTEIHMKRDRAILKKDAVPKIFTEGLGKRREEFLQTNGKESDFSKISNQANLIPLPSEYWFVNKLPQFIQWSSWSENLQDRSKRIIVKMDKSVTILLNEKKVNLEDIEKVQNVNDIVKLLQKVEGLKPCVCDDFPRSENCTGYVVKKKGGTPGRQGKTCRDCIKSRMNMRSKCHRMVDFKKKVQIVNKNWRVKHETAKRRKKGLIRNGRVLKTTIRSLQRQCATRKQEVMNGAIAMLSEKEQLAVRACFEASKVKGRQGIRYSRQWLYECILLRIKSKKAYKHLRKHKVLVLPTIKTLDKCLKKIKSAYGFDENVFKALKFKTDKMDPKHRHGAILLDEIKLSASMMFNRINLKFEGFTNLGNYTPEHQKTQLGDHALVFMFQSFFTGQIQTLGCFLSKGSASGTVLHKLLIECIVLAENSGLLIDVVTSDGASWNRNMWNIFGVTEQVVSIEHIVDPTRRLWFISDFPHLIKCLRNFFIKHQMDEGIWTPDGIVALRVWYALLEVEDTTSYQIKVNFKLRREHLQPKYYQKMNVALSFQFFGIADLLHLFENRHPELEECEPVRKLCKRIKSLIGAMNSNTAFAGMSPGNESYKIVQDFLEYLEEWRKTAMKEGYEFITESTYYGLKISLKAALEVCDYLVNSCGFTYLLTARLCQDALERFFGMMRESCGANDHPDSNLFIQMYRLISTYSLARPPKGSNVTSTEILDVLLNIKNIEDVEQRKEQFEGQLDTILDNGDMDVFAEAVSVQKQHDYSYSEPMEYATAYMAGYVARKAAGRFAKYIQNKKQFTCNECLMTLLLPTMDVIPESHKYIEVKSRGFLLHPSRKLTCLIRLIETAIMSVLEKKSADTETLFKITTKLEEMSPVPQVGCKEHVLTLTHRIITFYLTTRMFFIAKQCNKNNEEREKTKEKRKAAKLTVSSRAIIHEPEAMMKKCIKPKKRILRDINA